MTKKPAEIDYSKNFDKELKKAPLEIKIAFRQRLNHFIQDQFHPALKNHSLKGRLKRFRSINITGDWRAIYSIAKENKVIIFEILGTHSQLYK